MAETRPLVLDVDGTFLRTDMLFECFWAGLGKDPLATLRASLTHLRHPQHLKRELAGIADLRTDLLPVSAQVAHLVDAAKADGREIVLASASHTPLVADLARHHDLSPRVFGSTDEVNLKGAAKADALTQAYGERGFDYAGDAEIDRVVWDRAGRAVIVGHHPVIARALRDQSHEVTELPGGWRKRDLMRALRPHQWVKNVLLLVSAIASHHFDAMTLMLVLFGIAAFSAAASSIYIVNDLLDLEADRLHATKHRRPFASGAVPIHIGMATSVALGLIAIAIGAWLGPAFLAVVVLYMVLSLAYSLRLKRLRWIDIATLASLYTLRVIAGAAAVEVYVSGYLLVFIFPAFLTLGCVKRMTEVALAKDNDRLPGRGYGKPDRGDLLNVACLGAFAAVLIFFLYSFTDQARMLYPTQWLLWLAILPLAAWLIRMIVLGYQGRQDYDPIVFAMRDKHGLGLIFLMLSMMFYSAGLWQQWIG